MKLIVKKATTDVTVYLFIQDSTVTTGAGKTGLVYNSSGLVCYYVRPLAAAAALTLATQTVTGAHSDGGFVEVDATNMPGIYRLDLSDAICATGVNSVVVMLKGATGMAPVTLEIQLANFDPNDGVRFGLTALPNAVPAGSGGLPTVDASNGVTLSALTTAGQAAVQTECNDALVAQNLDHLVKIAVDTDFDTTVANDSVIGYLAHQTGETFDRAFHSLQKIGPGIWDEALNSHNSSGSVGELLNRMKRCWTIAATIVDTAPTTISFKGATTLSTVDGYYVGMTLVLYSGPNAGVPRRINAYTGATRLFAFEDAFPATPTNGDSLLVVGFEVKKMRGTDSAALSATALTNATWTDTRAGKLDNLDTNVGSRSSHAAADVWAVGTRTLTSFGTLAADTATAVWAAGTRTLSSFGTLVADVWAYATRTLTAISDSAGITTLLGRIPGVVQPQTGDAYARLGAPAGASVSADVVAVKAETASIQADTNDIQTRLPAALVGGKIDASVSAFDAALDLNATMKASVNAEADTALADVNLDHVAGTATGIPAIPAGTYLDQLMDDGTAIFDRTTDSLQAIRDRGDAAWGGGGSAPTADEVAQAVMRRDVDTDAAAAAKQSVCMAVLALTSKQTDDGAGNLKTYRKDGSTLALTQTITTDAALVPVRTVGVGA